MEKRINTTLSLISIVLLGLTNNVKAAVKCPEAKVQMLNATEDKLFIQLEGQSWHVLALNSDNDYEKKLTRAMKAQKKDRAVQLTFPNGYDETCLSSNTDVVAKKIKLMKKERYKEQG